MVTALTASSTGNTAGSSFSRSITTEVSTIPRALRVDRSGTGRWVLRAHAIKVLPEPRRVERGGVLEQGDGGFSTNETVSP